MSDLLSKTPEAQEDMSISKTRGVQPQQFAHAARSEGWVGRQRASPEFARSRPRGGRISQSANSSVRPAGQTHLVSRSAFLSGLCSDPLLSRSSTKSRQANPVEPRLLGIGANSIRSKGGMCAHLPRTNDRSSSCWS